MAWGTRGIVEIKCLSEERDEVCIGLHRSMLLGLHRSMLLGLLAIGLLGLLSACGLAAASSLNTQRARAHGLFRIDCIDAETGHGVPLVQLKTPSYISCELLLC
eukprot:SAG31_NODE_2876_length_4970_cov_2.820776_6_plen_104_part_00